MSSDKDQSTRRSPRTLWFRAGLSLFLVSLLVSRLDTTTTVTEIADAHVGLLLLGFALFFAERIFVAYRWYMLLVHLIHGVPFTAILHVVFTSSFLGLMLPGTVGFDAIRVYGVAKTTSDFTVTLSSFVVERMIALAALCLIFLAGVQFSPLPLAWGLVWVGWIGIMGLSVGFILMIARTPRRLIRRALNALGLCRLTEKLVLYSNALDLYRSRPFVLLKAALLGILFQLLRILQVMITALALGIDLPTTFYLAIVPVVMVAILIPITFFGLGVRDFSLVYFLSFAGIAAELAFAVSILLALMTVVATLPGAWLYLRSGVHREHVQPKRGFPTDADPKTTRIHGKHRS